MREVLSVIGWQIQLTGEIMADNISDLDRFDHAILATLAQDGRISITDLAKCIGLSKSPTQARDIRRRKQVSGWGRSQGPW